MLSILIPTYNYSALPLVTNLHQQCVDALIEFEIIVLDDGSTDSNSLLENEKINTLTNTRFEKNEVNLGRARNLNLLAEKSSYTWLLFMDCDTFPKKSSFIIDYIKAIKATTNRVFFGGIAYKQEFPNENQVLRWYYGKNREEINLQKRETKPYETTLTSNILITKEVFDTVLFNEKIVEYGYEDLVFISQLKSTKIAIKHIDNPTYHLNYETSEVFLAKTRKALETLKFIEDKSIILSLETKIQKTYQTITFLKLNKIISFLFTKLQQKAEQNLLSKKPSLFIFDLYKLGYYCKIK